MSTEDNRAITRINREQYMAAIGEDLNKAWRAILTLPEDDRRREVALDALKDAWETNHALASLIQEAEAAMQAAHDAMMELRSQRDQALTELNDYAEQHNAAFWESLPYDMADVLGGQWTHMDASTLFEIITLDETDVDAGGNYYGFTPDQLRAFRANLLAMLKAFTGRTDLGDNHDEDL